MAVIAQSKEITQSGGNRTLLSDRFWRPNRRFSLRDFLAGRDEFDSASRELARISGLDLGPTLKAGGEYRRIYLYIYR